MLTPSERSRYARHLRLPELGEGGQLRLKSGSVVIIGAGGLGSPAAMYLASAGVGRIGIVDFDTVDLSNLQRQILYGTDAIGRPKVEMARQRLTGMNPEVEVEIHPVALSSSNALEILGRYDVVVDGTDNFPTRYLVSDACTILGKPSVYGTIFRFEGQASVFNTADGPCYRCLHPTPPPPHLVPNCAEAGVLGVLPGVIGTIQAAETVKILAGIGDTLAGRLLIFDALRMSFREVHLRKNCQHHEIVERLIDYEGFCNPMDDIDVKELAARIDRGETDFVLLDVREQYEWDAGRLAGASHIPMQQVPGRIAEIPREREIIVYCRTGGRSARVQQYLQADGYANVRNLIGGMTAWKKEIDPSIQVA